MHTDNVRRRKNGTIDIDFYRREAFFLRREATNQIFRYLWQVGRPAIGTATIIAAYVCALHLMFAPRATAGMSAATNTPANYVFNKKAAQPPTAAIKLKTRIGG